MRLQLCKVKYIKQPIQFKVSMPTFAAVTQAVTAVAQPPTAADQHHLLAGSQHSSGGNDYFLGTQEFKQHVNEEIQRRVEHEKQH